MTEWNMENPQVKGANQMPTFEEAQLTGQANQILENELSSVKIISKVEMKSGKRHTEWEIKCKHDDPLKAKGAAVVIDQELRSRYEKKI
jgi:hypothetical protein